MQQFKNFVIYLSQSSKWVGIAVVSVNELVPKPFLFGGLHDLQNMIFFVYEGQNPEDVYEGLKYSGGYSWCMVYPTGSGVNFLTIFFNE